MIGVTPVEEAVPQDERSVLPERKLNVVTMRAGLSGPVASYVRRRSSPHASVMQVAFYDVELCAWRSMHVGDYIGRVADEE